MPSDDPIDDVDAMRDAHRAAVDQLDERPDPRVRATVLAAAARQVGSRPEAVSARGVTDPSGRPRARRWSWSAAALLMVSIGTGLLAARALRDEPDRLVAVAANTTPSPPSVERAPAPAERAAIEQRGDAEREAADVATTRPSAKPALPRPPRSSGVRATPRDGAAAVREPDRRAAAVREPDRIAPDDERRKTEDAPPAAASSLAASPAQPAGPPPSTAAPVPARAAPSPSMRLRSARAVEPPTPEAWVERIVRLRGDGNDDEADRELDALRVRYPGFTVPQAALRPAGTR